MRKYFLSKQFLVAYDVGVIFIAHARETFVELNLVISSDGGEHGRT